MKIQKIRHQDGFHIIEITLVLVVLLLIGFTAMKVAKKETKTPNTQTSQSSQAQTNKTSDTGPVKWTFNDKENEYFVQTGIAPACKEPFAFDYSPVDLSKIYVIGMPGSYRGFNYKPHGGLRLNDPSDGTIDVRMPMDAKLVGLTRYYEGNPAELQYLLYFESDCGIAFRFDHLYTLTPDLQKIAETTPEPKLNDTQSDPNIKFTPVAMKAGDTVATAIGFKTTKNFGFDFGVYDYRSRNEISKNKTWAAIHNTFTAQEWFGRCWTEMLPVADVAKAKELSLVVVNPAKPNIVSDYCTYAPHTTLDINNGQPTDG